ncbi:MAG: TonB-dependent receptor [Ignavibacteriales bacterium]|nr:TonB-dependent receptor [Ignavibacteriales bacterium]MCF8315054.1 TonB-dependent receptor [Ignavibacteriales bacterium]MCF8435950.1 TonB-dependent receptor [Ignavibacteriales bacterium]
MRHLSFRKPFYFFYAIFFLMFFRPGDISGEGLTLTGRLLDISDDTPVQGAVISIVNCGKYTTSDFLGKFHFTELDSVHLSLKITHIAYKENVVHFFIDRTEDKILNIFLTPKVLEINPVIVSGFHSHSVFEEIAEKSSSMKGKELEKNLSFSLASTLKNEAGFAIRSMGPAPARPVIRGLSGDRVMMAEDGTKTTDLSATSPDHAVSIDPFSPERIEVIRGPRVLTKTSTTIGGVVNVVRHEIPFEMRDKFYGTTGLYGESANSGFLYSAGGELPVYPFMLKGEFSRRVSGDMNSPGGVLENTQSKNTNYSFGSTFFFHEGLAGVSYRDYSLDYGIPGGFVGAHPNGVNISMYRNQFNFRSQFDIVQEYIEKIQLDYSYALYRHKEFEAADLIGAEFKVGSHMINGSLHFKDIAYAEKGIIGFSSEVKKFEMGGFVFTPQSDLLNLSVFSFQTFSAGDFNFESGFRINFDRIKPEISIPDSKIGNIRERKFTTWSASFSALYPLSNRVFAGVNISRSSRVPTIEELYSQGPHLAAYSYETGNPDLSSENGYGSEFFIFHRFKSLYFNLNLFYNYLNSYIIPVNTGTINYQTFLPIFATRETNVTLTGFDFEMEYDFMPDFQLKTTIGYTSGKYRATGKPLPQIPPLKGMSEIILDLGKISISAQAEWALEQTRVDEFEQPTAGYFINNLFVQGSFVKGGYIHNISVAALNIFNKTYRNHLSRIKSILPEPGFSARATYKLFFEI